MLHFSNVDKADDVEDGANYGDGEGSNSRYPELVNLKSIGHEKMKLLKIRNELISKLENV